MGEAVLCPNRIKDWQSVDATSRNGDLIQDLKNYQNKETRDGIRLEMGGQKPLFPIQAGRVLAGGKGTIQDLC